MKITLSKSQWEKIGKETGWMTKESGKRLQRITIEIKDEEELLNKLKDLSLNGGAWVYTILPFSHTTNFSQYKNPSSVPDYYKDLSRNRIGWKGQVIEFTKAAQIREQNRGLGVE